MTKQEKQQPSKSADARKAHKQARTAANAARRAKKHAARMAQQCSHPKRGLARAMRRWCDGTSKQPAVVLTTHKKLASLVRAKPKERVKKERPLLVTVNGKVVGSMAELLWMGRELGRQHAERQREMRLAS